MRYVANPVIVDAFQIIGVASINEYSIARHVKLDNEVIHLATEEMCARYSPKIGDYWVIQSDGYQYINPKEVFERKYRLCNGFDALNAAVGNI